jgi:hypothetical protein
MILNTGVMTWSWCGKSGAGRASLGEAMLEPLDGAGMESCTASLDPLRHLSSLYLKSTALWIGFRHVIAHILNQALRLAEQRACFWDFLIKYHYIPNPLGIGLHLLNYPKLLDPQKCKRCYRYFCYHATNWLLEKRLQQNHQIRSIAPKAGRAIRVPQSHLVSSIK